VSSDYRLKWVENLLGLREGDRLRGRRYQGMTFEPDLFADGTCYPDDRDSTVSLGVHERWVGNPLATLMIALHEFAHARDGASEAEADVFAGGCLRPVLGDIPAAVLNDIRVGKDWRKHISEAVVIAELEKSGEPWAQEIGHVMHYGDPITKSIEREALFVSKLKDAIRFQIYASFRDVSKELRK
jgi:hypothetical protein